MKIYITHSSNYDYKNELYIPLRSSELNKKYDIFLPHEADEFINTKEIIKNSDLVIAEVSFPATGEGIELGWANDANVKVICIYKEGTKVSGSLKVVSDTFITYSDANDMLDKLLDVLLTLNLSNTS